MPTLKHICRMLGWPRLRRTSHLLERIKGLEATAAVETTLEGRRIEWPAEWCDRGQVRRFDDTRNYPAAGPGIVYDRQICELLGHHSPERVRQYHLLPGPHGTRLPRGWLRPDEYFSYWCTEAQAAQILDRIRYHERD